MTHPSCMIGRGPAPEPKLPDTRFPELAARLRGVIEEHRGNRTPTYAGTSDYVPIAVLDELLEEFRE